MLIFVKDQLLGKLKLLVNSKLWVEKEGFLLLDVQFHPNSS